jgi:hypothetical protein
MPCTPSRVALGGMVQATIPSFLPLQQEDYSINIDNTKYFRTAIILTFKKGESKALYYKIFYRYK